MYHIPAAEMRNSNEIFVVLGCKNPNKASLESGTVSSINAAFRNTNIMQKKYNFIKKQKKQNKTRKRKNKKGREGKTENAEEYNIRATSKCPQ